MNQKSAPKGISQRDSLRSIPLQGSFHGRIIENVLEVEFCPFLGKKVKIRASFGAKAMSGSTCVFDEILGNLPVEGRMSREYLDSLPDSKMNYVIYFTPRSGSTWLCSMISSLEYFGIPSEWFNPKRYDYSIKKNKNHPLIPRCTLEEYVRWNKGIQAVKCGVSGLKIAHNQLALLNGRFDLHRELPAHKEIFLYRKDILMQAVSLYKASATGLFHSVNITESTNVKSKIDYDDKAIMHFVNKIYEQEKGYRELFAKNNIKVLEFTYEDLVKNPGRELKRLIAFLADNSDQDIRKYDSMHEKIGDEINLDFATRFAREHASFLEEINEQRMAIHRWANSD